MGNLSQITYSEYFGIHVKTNDVFWTSINVRAYNLLSFTLCQIFFCILEFYSIDHCSLRLCRQTNQWLPASPPPYLCFTYVFILILNSC
jgi:hypothetical protein